MLLIMRGERERERIMRAERERELEWHANNWAIITQKSGTSIIFTPFHTLSATFEKE